MDGALRLDPTNDTLKKQMEKIRPQYERAEKTRISKLDPKEKMKEEGDAWFREANFEKAAVSYTKCLNTINEKVLHF